MKVLGIVSLILIACALLCGLWIRFHPQGSDMRFHFFLSLAAMLFAFITIMLFMIRTRFI